VKTLQTGVETLNSARRQSARFGAEVGETLLRD